MFLLLQTSDLKDYFLAILFSSFTKKAFLSNSNYMKDSRLRSPIPLHSFKSLHFNREFLNFRSTLFWWNKRRIKINAPSQWKTTEQCRNTGINSAFRNRFERCTWQSSKMRCITVFTLLVGNLLLEVEKDTGKDRDRERYSVHSSGRWYTLKLLIKGKHISELEHFGGCCFSVSEDCFLKLFPVNTSWPHCVARSKEKANCRGISQ